MTGETVLQLVPAPPEPRSNLPMQLTSFIGREREQAEVVALLGRARLVTLTGAGGSGKTRLALTVASKLLQEYPDGVWLVELAALADPALVPQTVTQALDLQEHRDRTPLEVLIGNLRHRRALLVLDNCEHLVAACADLATTLLRSCPRLRLLATSREALEVAGEALYRVPTLTVPDLIHLPPPDRLVQYEAVQLFLERAQARRLDFALSSTNARAVAAVCTQLDGMPLAVELAAARVSALPVESIAMRLDDRFRLLTGGPRTALPRQQTLRATLDWSHDLLSLSEQVLLRRLAVFAGGWTIEAAETVCADEAVAAGEILDLLSSLVNKSLVQAEEVDGRSRYRLLETVRQYGHEQLAAAGEEAAVQDAHLAYFLALAEQAVSAYFGPKEEHWFARLEAEHDNLRAALHWSLRAGDAGLRLAGVLGGFWMARGYLGEGRTWLEAALARGSAAAPVLQARVLYWAGHLAWMQGEHEVARTTLEASRALSREVGDNEWAGNSLIYLAAIALHQQRDLERARTLLEEALELAQAVHHTPVVVQVLYWLGTVAFAAGDYGRAAALHEECVALARELGSQRFMAAALFGLANVRHAQEEFAQAAALLEESFLIGRAIGYRFVVALDLESLAWVATADRRPRQAARLGGAAEALREALGVPLRPEHQLRHDQAVQAMQAALGAEVFAAAWAAGRTLAQDQAVALAVEHRWPAEPQAD